MSRTTLLVTLGRRNGVMDLPFGKFRAGWLARKLKANHMARPRISQGNGLAPQSESGDGAAPTETRRQVI